MSLRIARSALLFLAGISAIVFNNMLAGYSALFGIVLSISALLTVVYLFINLDKDFKSEIVSEVISDGFSGVILFTYPLSGQGFFIIVFSFWMMIQGSLMISRGVVNLKNKDSFPVLMLTGIVLIVLSFIVINYNAENMSSVNYVIGFTIIMYASANLFLNLLRKNEI